MRSAHDRAPRGSLALHALGWLESGSGDIAGPLPRLGEVVISRGRSRVAFLSRNDAVALNEGVGLAVDVPVHVFVRLVEVPHVLRGPVMMVPGALFTVHLGGPVLGGGGIDHNHAERHPGGIWGRRIRRDGASLARGVDEEKSGAVEDADITCVDICVGPGDVLEIHAEAIDELLIGALVTTLG